MESCIYCLDCKRARGREDYRRHKEERIVKVRKRTEINLQNLNRLKQKPCTDCGRQYPHISMDFDHRESECKIDNVSRLISSSWARIEKEVDKCDLVCSNCHRIRTYVRYRGTKIIVLPKKAQESSWFLGIWRFIQDKKNAPCTDCKKTYHPSAMDFDHRDPKTKTHEPSDLTSLSMEEARNELAACDLVCSNCHRLRTARLQKWLDI